jgi:LPS sulfotransferase NodH
VLQAVSLLRASQTGSWIHGQSSSVKESAEGLVYDHHEIDRRVRKIVLDNASWMYFLNLQRLPWIHLVYEDVAVDMKSAFESVGALIDCDLQSPAMAGELATVRQSSEVNLEWEARYLSESGGLSLFQSPARSTAFAQLALRRLKRRLSRFDRSSK